VPKIASSGNTKEGTRRIRVPGCGARVGVFLLVVESLSGLEVERGGEGRGWGEKGREG